MDSGQPCTSANLPDSSSSSYSTVKKTDCGSEDASSFAVVDSTNNSSQENHSKRFIKESKIHLLSDSEDSFEVFLPKKKITPLTSKAAPKPAGKVKAKKTVSRSRACPYFSSKSTVKSFFKPPPKSQEEKDLELALARSLLDVSGSGESPLVAEPAPVKPPPPQEPTFTLKNWTGKGTKKHKSQKYILLRRTREERENIITQKLGIVLLAGTESSDETFSKINIELSSSHLQGFYVQNSKLWELSKLSVDCFVSDFYVDSFKTIIDPPSSSEFYDLKNSPASPQISTSGEPDTDQWTVLEENQQAGDNSGGFEPTPPSVESDHLKIAQYSSENNSDPTTSSSTIEENKNPMEHILEKNISSSPYLKFETVDQTLEESQSQRVNNLSSPSTVNENNQIAEPNKEKIDSSPPCYGLDGLDSDFSPCSNKEDSKKLFMSRLKLKEATSEEDTLSQKTMSLDGFTYTQEEAGRRSQTENFPSSRCLVETVEEPNIPEYSPITKDTSFSTSLESLKILSNDWQSLFKKSTFSDMDFRIDNTLLIPGHKIILHVRCPSLLEELDYQNLSHLSHRDFIDLSIYHKNAVITFLRYLYSGKTDRIYSLSEDEKNDLSLLGAKYKVSYLDKCLSINSKRDLIYDESTCSPPHDSNSSDSCLINDKPKNLNEADIEEVAVDLPCSLSNKKNLSNEDNYEKLRSTTSPDLFEVSNRSSGSELTKRKLDLNNETIEILDDPPSSRIKKSSSSVTNLDSIEIVDISNDAPYRRQSLRIKNRKSLKADIIVLNSDSNESFSTDTLTAGTSPAEKIVNELSHRSSPEDDFNVLVGRFSELVPETSANTFSGKFSLRKDDNSTDTSLTSSFDLKKLKNESQLFSTKDPYVTNKSPSNVTCLSSYNFSKKFSFQEENHSLNLPSTSSFDCRKSSDSAIASTSQNSPVLNGSPPKLSSSIPPGIYDEGTVLKSPVKYFSLKYEKSVSTRNVNEMSSSSENSSPPPKKKSVEDSLIVLSPDSDDDSKVRKFSQNTKFNDSGVVVKRSLNFPSTSSFGNDCNFNCSDDDIPQPFSPVNKYSSVDYQNSLPSTSFHSPFESCCDTLSKNVRSTRSKVKSVSKDSLYSKNQLSPDFNDYKAKNRNSSLDGYLQSSFPSGSFLDQVESQVPLASTSSPTGFPVKDFHVREGHQSTPQNLASTSRCLEEIKSSTPKDEQPSLIIKDATPRPDFNAMDTPELKKGLAKYGLKQNLEPKKAKSLLSYIYDQLHPNIPNQEEDKEDNNENQSEGTVNDVKDSEFVLEETPFNESIAENLPSEATVDPNNLKNIIVNFIKNDTNLHGSVITFQPLLFKEFYKILREQGVRCTVAQLMDTLDELCIVYRVERPERKTTKRKRKVNKT